MDVFAEQLIARKKTPAQIVCAVLIIVLTLVLVAVLFLLAPHMVLMFLLPIGVGVWWLLTGMNIEYEYCITNGVIDIDRITARRKRERVVSVSLEKLEVAGRYDPAKWQGKQLDRVVMAASSLKADGLYCFSYHSKKKGHTLVVFQPDERIHEAFGQGLSRLMQKDWNAD